MMGRNISRAIADFNHIIALCTTLCIYIAVICAVCLPFQTAGASETGCYSRADYILPPQLTRQGLSFAGVGIPLEKKDVNRRVHEQINFLLMDRRSRLLDWFNRLAEHGPIIRKVLAEENVPADLIYVAVLLGDLLPDSKSRTGGIGWWALSAPKGKKNQSSPWVCTDEWDDRRDVIISTKIACSILKGIQPKKGDGGWLMTIAAFADGSDKIEDITGKATGFSYWDLVMPPYSEVFIPRLIALKIIDTHRSFYKLNIPFDSPKAYAYLGRLKLTKDLPLYVAAKWCGVTPRDMWELNPGVSPSLGILPKAGPGFPAGLPLRVPAGKEQIVRKLLAKEGYL